MVQVVVQLHNNNNNNNWNKWKNFQSQCPGASLPLAQSRTAAAILGPQLRHFADVAVAARSVIYVSSVAAPGGGWRSRLAGEQRRRAATVAVEEPLSLGRWRLLISLLLLRNWGNTKL